MPLPLHRVLQVQTVEEGTGFGFQPADLLLMLLHLRSVGRHLLASVSVIGTHFILETTSLTT